MFVIPTEAKRSRGTCFVFHTAEIFIDGWWNEAGFTQT
jgi:hypothetical protein